MTTTTITLPIGDRAIVAYEQLLKRQDEKAAAYGIGLTDSDVLDVIDDNTTGACSTGCTTHDCCDNQRLASLVWLLVEWAAE